MTAFICESIGISCDDVTTQCEVQRAQTQHGIRDVEHWTASTYVTLFGATSVTPTTGHGLTEKEAIDDLNRSIESLQEMMWL